MVVHGDMFDGVIIYARWLAYIGDQAYTMLLKANQWLNAIRRRLQLPYWSLSARLKKKVKNAVQFITEYETVVAREALLRGVDGVVCGHIHSAEIRDMGGVVYYNDGDWVESCTALVEDQSGQMRLIDWAEHLRTHAYTQKTREKVAVA
jgi:UDP-2,3-diacylglucosamine pyrophosphatase LpxH